MYKLIIEALHCHADYVTREKIQDCIIQICKSHTWERAEDCVFSVAQTNTISCTQFLADGFISCVFEKATSCATIVIVCESVIASSLVVNLLQDVFLFETILT